MAILLSPAKIIEKLVALIPPPYPHQSRYFGILTSHSKWHRKILLKPEVKKGFVATTAGVERKTWARLVGRVFCEHIVRCPYCHGPLFPENFELVALASLVHGILHALSLSGRAPACAPPRLVLAPWDIDQSPAYPD